jgi:hypothetical protein
MAKSRVFFDFTIDNSPIGRHVLHLTVIFISDQLSELSSYCSMNLRQGLVRSTSYRISALSFSLVSSFRALCTGEKGVSPLSDRPLYFKHTIIHRLIRNFMIQGGGACNSRYCGYTLGFTLNAQISRNTTVRGESPFTEVHSLMKTSHDLWILRGAFSTRKQRQ